MMGKLCTECNIENLGFSWETTCWSCQQKAYRKNLIEQIQSGEITSTECESEIYCPYCGTINDIDDDYELWEEGEHENYCGNCEKTFSMTTTVSYSFDTERVDSGA